MQTNVKHDEEVKKFACINHLSWKYFHSDANYTCQYLHWIAYIIITSLHNHYIIITSLHNHYIIITIITYTGLLT